MFYEIDTSDAPEGIPKHVAFKIITQRMSLYFMGAYSTRVAFMQYDMAVWWFTHLMELLTIGYHDHMKLGRLKSLSTTCIEYENGVRVCIGRSVTDRPERILCIVQSQDEYDKLKPYIEKYTRLKNIIDICYPTGTLNPTTRRNIQWHTVHSSKERVRYEGGSVCIHNPKNSILF